MQMGDYSDLLGAAGLGVADHEANKRAPVVKALGTNAQALDLGVMAMGVFFPRVAGRHQAALQGATSAAAYATTRRLMTHFTGQATALDTSSHFERVDEDEALFEPESTLVAASF